MAQGRNDLRVIDAILGNINTVTWYGDSTLNLVNDGEWVRAGANIAGSVVCCLVAVWAGYLVAASLNTMKWV